MINCFTIQKIYIHILDKLKIFKRIDHLFIASFSLFAITIVFSSEALANGNLTIPSTGSITQPFLSQILPDTNGSYYDQNDQLQIQKTNQKFHSGVDISNGNTDCIQNLSPVYAASSGKVIYVDYDTSGFGWSIRIDHGLSEANNKYVFTLYAHMGMPDVKRKRGQSCLTVKQGDYVFEGQLIGYQGSSGNSTGTHLHWGTKVNPTLDIWRNKGSKWASPDFYTCMALTERDLSPLENVNAGQNICWPTLITDISIEAILSGVDVNPKTNLVYFASYGPRGVLVINGDTNTVNLIIPLPMSAYNVAVNSETNKIYVSNGSGISVIDGQNNTVLSNIGFGGQYIAINPTTNFIYTGNPGDTYIMVIDGINNSYNTLIPVGEYPSGIVVNPITNRIYVANEGSNTVSVIDGNKNTVIQTISVGSSPKGITVNPITNRIYVANNLSDNVSVIDGLTNTVIDTITLPPGLGYTAIKPTGIGVNPTTNHVFVGSETGSGPLSVIDGANNSILISLPGSGYNNGGIGVNPITNNVYVSHVGGSTVSVVQDR